MGCLKHSTVIGATALAVLTLLISGCSSAPTPTSLPEAVVETPAEQPREQQTDLLQSIRRELNTNNPEDLDTWALLDDVEQLIQQQNTTAAQALLYALAPHLLPSQFDTAKTLMALTMPEDQLAMRDWLDTPLSQPDIDLLRQYSKVQVLKMQGHQLEAMALEAQLKLDDNALHHSIFRTLSRLPDSELMRVEKGYSSLRPHVALVQITRQFGADSAALSQAIGQYQQVYFSHPLTQPLPPSIEQALAFQVTPINRIAVMLPLSGRFASTGDAIKQGVLAAYFAANETQTPPQITFLDTDALSTDQLLADAESADWVIGPLLKENIDAVVPRLPLTTKRLALNRLDPAQYQDEEMALTRQQTAYFALAPEDEAIQLANHVAKSGYKHPIIVASALGANKRMLETFVATWKQIQVPGTRTTALDVVEYDNIDTLDESLSEALGVAQSEENAKQIDRMTNRILFDQTRSRQDIDAIVVFSSPEEMALINPMVEASISPFRQQSVPVYATSRSIERSAARNTLRDLENVRFLDAPLLLRPDNWPEMTATINQVWPNQTANFSRLFAFGFDAFSMLPDVPRLAQLPAYQYAGMTGLLQMSDEGEITRSLPMAQIREQTVTEIPQ